MHCGFEHLVEFLDETKQEIADMWVEMIHIHQILTLWDLMNAVSVWLLFTVKCYKITGSDLLLSQVEDKQ